MAETIEAYTPARIDYLAKYLQTLLPGLDYTVAKKWITAEKGVSGNVLGTTYTSRLTGKQALYTYPSQEAGLRAAANWINTRSIYSGVKASLGGSQQQQAQALANSPWNHSYYSKVFAGLIGGQTTPSGGASTPTTPTPKLADWQVTLAKYGISTDPTHKLTQAESDILANNVYHVDPKLFGSNLVGKTIPDLMKNGTINFDPIQTAKDVAASFDLAGAALFIGVILVGIALIVTGGLIFKGKAS